MDLKKLDKKVLKLWYIRATFILLILLGVFIAAAVIPLIAGAPDDITLVIILCVAIPVALLFALKAISAVLCYKNNGLAINNGKITAYYGGLFRNITVFMRKNLDRLLVY